MTNSYHKMKIKTSLTLRYLDLTAILVIGVFVILEELLYPEDGYDMLSILNVRLLAVWLISFVALLSISYYMARIVLKPVTRIIRQVDKITASNLSERLEIENKNDEIGELAMTFNDTLDRLEKSFKAQEMFLSNVSHELRTPMSALIAELELSLHKDRSNEDYKMVVERALNDARNIERLSNGIMDLAKTEIQEDRISKSIIRLDEILLDAITIITKANKDYNIDLQFDEDSDDDTFVTIKGNEYLIRTAFVNLLENGCKFSPDHKSSVIITFRQSKVAISFEDSGIGISPTDIEKIFEPFYRGKNGDTYKGNGIGLALVDRIVRLHSGTIHVDSKEGKGTTFTLEFNHI